MLKSQQNVLKQVWKKRRIDVSYLKDSLSSSPVRNLAFDQVIMKRPESQRMLPTEMEHLRKMIEATDDKRVPKVGDHVVLTSCSRGSCLNHNHWKDVASSVSLGPPAGRQDALNLREWYDMMSARQLDTEDRKVIEEAAVREIVRQVAVHCQERADLLQDLLSANLEAVTQATEAAQARVDKAKQRFAKQRSQMEKSFQEQIDRMRRENALQVRKLDEAEAKIMRLQGDLNISRFKVKDLEAAVAKHSSDRADWFDKITEPMRHSTGHDRPEIRHSRVVNFQLKGTRDAEVQASCVMWDRKVGRKLKRVEAETQHSLEVAEAETLTEVAALAQAEAQGVTLAQAPVEANPLAEAALRCDREQQTEDTLYDVNLQNLSHPIETPFIKYDLDESDFEGQRVFTHCYAAKQPLVGLVVLSLVNGHVETAELGEFEVPQSGESGWDGEIIHMNEVISVIAATPDDQDPDRELDKSSLLNASQFSSKLVNRLTFKIGPVDSKLSLGDSKHEGEDRANLGDSKQSLESRRNSKDVSSQNLLLDSVLQEKEQLLERLQEDILKKTKQLEDINFNLKYRRASFVDADEVKLLDFQAGFNQGHSKGFKLGEATGWERGRVDGLEEAAKRDIRRHQPAKLKNFTEVLRKNVKKLTRFKQFTLGNRRDLKGMSSHANLASKLLEKFLTMSQREVKRKARTTTKMTVKLITGFYNSAIQRSKTGEFPDGLIELVYDETLQRFGLKAVGEKKFMEFMASASVASENPTVGLFCRLCGITQPPYSRLSFKFYVQALHYMLQIKIGIAMNEDIERQYYPLVRAAECAREKLQDLPINVAEVQAAIDKKSMADPRKINAGGVVELDIALEVMLSYYEDYLMRTAQAVTSVVTAYRDPPTYLELNELFNAVSLFSPSKLSVVTNDGTPTEVLGELMEEGCINLESLVLFCQEKVIMTWLDFSNVVQDPEELSSLLRAKMQSLTE
jgi:hypothetical protein